MTRRALALALLLAVGCGRRGPDRRPWLSDAYSPTASPALDLPELQRPRVELQDGKHRISVIGPNGRSYGIRWDSVSQSTGAPNRGGVRDAAQLPASGPGFKHVGKNPWGTDEAVTFLQLAAYVVHDMFPDTTPVLIGDISRDGGGHLNPHRSHQSGRDADVGLFADGNKPLRGFVNLSPSELDLDKTWALMETLLRTGQVLYIFLDRRLQPALYNHARDRGWSEASLDRVFQYPGGRERTIVRHVPGHGDHMHVRFTCAPDDPDCSD